MFYGKFLGLIALLLVTGCAAPARIEQMAVHLPNSVIADTPLKKSVAVTEVTGGRESDVVFSSVQ
jgi:uncharacterized lipoprotein YajG